MKLRLMTPEGTLFEGEATSVRGRSPGGEFEVLPGHGAWVSPAAPCCLTVGVAAEGGTNPAAASSAEPGELLFAVHGGLVEVGPDSVLVLADAAEGARDIDEARAGRARERAEERLRLRKATEYGSGQHVDVDRAHSALARASARLAAHATRLRV